MVKLATSALWVGLVGSFATACAPRGPSPHARQSAIAAGRAVVERVMREHEIPGVQVAVAMGDRVVWSEGFGLADVSSARPVTTGTRFRLGSVSKLVTVYALARLVAEGRLDLDAPVQTYVPTFPDKGQRITARALAGHLAGIRHYDLRDVMGPPRHFATVGDSLAVFANDPLVAPPGERYAYSSYGYTLLSAALEGASGEPFLALVGRLMGELGLTSIGPDDARAELPERTRFYARPGVEAAPHDSSAKWAGGGLLGTAEDLVRFAAAHGVGRRFDEATRALLFTPQKTSAGEATGVGLGWRIGEDPAGRVVHHHAGSMDGCRAVLVYYPHEDVAVALLSNRSRTPQAIEAIAFELAAPFLTP